MTVTARDVAAQLRARIPGIGNVKLQKLLYYCQGHHLAATGEPIFPETVSAWDMGPVVGQFWKEEHGGEHPLGPIAIVSEAALNTIGYVVSRYGLLTGTDLAHLTHSETPWIEADQGRPQGESAKIPMASMQHYFQDEDHDDEVAETWQANWASASEQVRADARPDSAVNLREDSRDGILSRRVAV